MSEPTKPEASQNPDLENGHVELNAEQAEAAAKADVEQEIEQELAEQQAQTGEGEGLTVAQLLEQLEAEKAKVAEQQDGVVRAKAEVENMRRRAAMDVEKAHKFALERFANELLPVVDNMELALQHANHEDEALKPMIEGVELTLKTLLSAIEKNGLEIFEPLNEAFDPARHQAMGMQEVEGVAPNTVIAVMQKGYELNGRLIRPAMVMISKAASVDTSA
ncbi:nucleotide exchange factor GrpE [Alginatibacterium sediminis]|uniref:Protein GrpE n=1 Tax=Alginatibacterium sediminis TaxID=2164068 RepID=A0A420E8N2_9ALTE|nr:nucleotide exchange factor GrpE [Alginatibacterium sediminis]RKF15624.1 nucleotide exchange factor GrpE [Alginatibacterium sediminis]